MAIQKIYPTKDTYIANHSHSSWYIYQSGLCPNVWIGSWDWVEYENRSNFYAYQSRALLHFKIPEFTADTTIIKAVLKVRFFNGGPLYNERNKSVNNYNENPKIDIHEIMQQWDEGTGTGYDDGHQRTGATWTNRNGKGNSWSRRGGYYDDTAIAASKTQNIKNTHWEFDITNLVKKWINDPVTNHGLLIKYANDHLAQGSLFFFSKDSGNDQLVPYIEIEYNTPPEKPRGLSPNFGSFICQDLSHSMHFKWSFIDTAAPPAMGKTDVVFLINVSKSMHWRMSHIQNQINNYINRMDAESVDWNIGIIAFSDTRLGEPLHKYGMFNTKNNVMNALRSLPLYNGGDYPSTGLEATMDSKSGALSFRFRENSFVQFMYCTDSPFHNKSGVETYYGGASPYEVVDVANELKRRGILASMATNTHCGSYTQLRLFPQTTGGQYLEENNNWGDQFKIKTIKSADQALAYDEGDYQSKAQIRIWEVKPNGSKTQVLNHTINGDIQDYSVKGLGVPWKEGASYEWDVRVFDKRGAASPWSDKARFTYIVDVNAAIGIPMFREEIMIGQTINRKALHEIREKLYYEVRKYRNLDPGIALSLFESEVVPSKEDMKKLKQLMDSMLVSDGLPPLDQDLIEKALGVSDIEYIRNKLVEVSRSNPDNPPGGIARKSKGMMHRPISIFAKNNNALDTTIDVSWAPAEYLGEGWLVDLKPSVETDINYYKVYYEETIRLTNSVKRILTEVYMKGDQITEGHIYVPVTGRADSQRMWYHAHDMNGRSSTRAAEVTFQSATIGTNPTTVKEYVVQRQQKHWSATTPDVKGTWINVYQGKGTSFVDTVWADGSYWYRVAAIDSTSRVTDWTYSQSIVYVRH